MISTPSPRDLIEALRSEIQRTGTVAADELALSWKLYGEIERVQRQLAARGRRKS